MKHLFILALFFTMVENIFSQVQLQGTISSSNNGKTVPVEFANIVLYSEANSTEMIAGTVSDLKGNYLFGHLETGSYRIVISCIGYKTLSQPIRIVMPSSGDMLIRNYTLEPDSKQLSEVVVEGQFRHQYIDHASYTFTMQDIKSARYSKDLLAKLPELTVDAQSQKIKSMKGGSLLILVNGATATDNELKMLPPDKVLRVEYYDFPPARYAGVGAVVNIITRSLDNGYGGGLDLSHAFTTGFANDNAYFAYNKGRNQLSIEYALNYRNYRKRESNELYRYTLKDEVRESQYFRKDKFGYATNTLGLKYTNQMIDRYIFQIAFKPNFENRFSNGYSDITNTFGDHKELYYGTNDNKTRIFSPVIDMYFWKGLSKERGEISINLVGTMFRTSVSNKIYEYLQPDLLQTLEDKMNLENRKRSLIGEVAYTKKMNFANWNSGYKMDAGWLDSDIDNLLGSFDYRSHYIEHYLYSEISGMKNKYLYRLSLGGKYVMEKSYSNDYNQFVFTPQILAGYQINDRNTIRLLFTRDTELPSVSDLSNNAQVITSDIISKGNPLLVNATQTITALMYTLNHRLLNLNAALLYSYTDKPIHQYFTEDGGNNYIALTKENAAYGKQYGGYLSGQFKPFGKDIFSIKTSAQFFREQVKSNLVGNIFNWYIPVDVETIIQTKKWMLSYQYRFTSRSLQGAYLIRDENQSHFIARYNHNRNWSLTAGMLWMFTPSRYHNETVPGSLVYHRKETKIRDNKSMFVIGFSWNFNKGKDYKVNRTLINEDKDPATF